MDGEVSIKKQIDDEVDQKTILTFIQTQMKYVKVFAGNDAHILANCQSQRFTDTTISNVGNSGGYLLPLWKTLCNDIKNAGKNRKFKKKDKNEQSH